MNKRNDNFARALAYLKEHGDIKSQKELAQRMGVSEDTISRILQGARVSESSITKLHAATNGLFNLQWLHGQSDVMLSAEVIAAQHASPTPTDVMIAAIVSAKDDTIASLKRELAAKDETIAAKDSIISTKDTLIDALQRQIENLRLQAAADKGFETGHSHSASAEHQGMAAYEGK